MGLLQKPDGRRSLVPAGQDPALQRDDTLILVRSRAFAVPLNVDKAPAADTHLVRAVVEFMLRCPPRPDDLAALHQALLNGPQLAVQDVADAIDRAGGLAMLRGFVAERPASRLVHEDLRGELLERLRGELKRFLFSSGLVLDDVGKVEFASDTLTEHDALERDTARRVKELESRDLVERTALAATHRRLDDLGTILGKLKAAAQSDAGMRWRELLPTLTPSERGRLLENLWRLTPDRTTAAAIVAVTDRECVWLDPQQPREIAHQLALPGDLGGLRSVEHDPSRGWLLIGAATGVWAVLAQDRQVAGRFTVPDAGEPKTGFNSAVIVGDYLVATHSQLGCWRWALAAPDAAEPLLRPSGGVPRTVRAATATDDGHVLFAADDEVYVLTPAGQVRHTLPVGRGVVRDIAVLDRTVYVTTSDGLVLEDRWDAPDIWQVLYRRSGPIESIQARSWDDLVELVIPAGAEGVLGVYGHEGMTARLLAATAPIRRAWACDDTLVGLTESRDRLIVSNANMAQRAGVDVPLARLVGRSIQDACVVTRHEGTTVTEPRQSCRGRGTE